MMRRTPPACVCLTAGQIDVPLNFVPEAMQPVLLFVKYSLDALLPTGAVDLRGDCKGLTIC
jgi:hypothetical protein